MRDPTQTHGSLASGASAADVINTIEATGRSVGLAAADVSSLAADISPGPFRDPHAGVWMPHRPAAPPSDGQPSAGFWCPLGSVEAQEAARTADWGGVEDAALAAERVRRMAADDELHAHLEEQELARQAELEAVEAGTGAAAMLQSAVEAEASGKVKVEPAEQMYVARIPAHVLLLRVRRID